VRHGPCTAKSITTASPFIIFKPNFTSLRRTKVWLAHHDYNCLPLILTLSQINPCSILVPCIKIHFNYLSVHSDSPALLSSSPTFFPPLPLIRILNLGEEMRETYFLQYDGSSLKPL
jgi:hypothetical protein